MTQPWFLRVATHNWQLKLLAVALAVLLWVVVSAEQLTTTWISVPVEIQQTDPSYRVIESSVPEVVRVRFVGPGREFIDLAVRHPTFLVRVRDVDAAEQVFELDPSMVRLPDGLEVSARDVEPQSLRLRFQEMASRELPVRIATAPGFGRGWTLVGPVRVSPSRVRIYGPAAEVASVRSISTVPLSVEDLDAPFELVLPLQMTDSADIELSTPSVRVSGRSERVLERRFGVVPVSIGAGVAIQPNQADLTIRGGRAAVTGVAEGALRVVLAIDSIPTRVPPGGLLLPLRIEGLPPGVSGALLPASVRMMPTRAILDSVAASAQGDTSVADP